MQGLGIYVHIYTHKHSRVPPAARSTRTWYEDINARDDGAKRSPGFHTCAEGGYIFRYQDTYLGTRISKHVTTDRSVEVSMAVKHGLS